MIEMRLATLTSFILLAGIATSAPAIILPQAVPSRRLVTRGEMSQPLQEILIDLKDTAGSPGDIAAMRICSQEPLRVAIFTAVMSPLGIGERLVRDKSSGLSYSRDRVMILRSSDCPVTHPPYVPLEFWAVPKGAALPPHVEAVKLCQVTVEGFGYQNSIRSWVKYREALKALVTKLRESLDATAVIHGEYNVRPSASMRRALKYAEQYLGHSGLPHSRYFVSLKPSATYDPKYNPEREPRYPNLVGVSITEDCEAE